MGYDEYYSDSSDYYEDEYTAVYTDGAARNNGRGGASAGWGNYYGPGDSRNSAGRFRGPQTNQRAELEAVNKALKQNLREAERDEGGPIRIRTDSKYSIESSTNWANKWERNGYTNARGEPVKNSDVIQDIRRNMSEIQDIRGSKSAVQFEYVPAHSGNPGNEAADRLATRAADRGGYRQ